LPSNVSNLKVMTSSNTVFSNNKIATYNNEEMAVKNQAGAMVMSIIISLIMKENMFLLTVRNLRLKKALFVKQITHMSFLMVNLNVISTKMVNSQ